MALPTARTLTLGSRPSKLARWQSEFILAQLQAVWPGLTLRMVTLVTTGDQILNRPLPEIGGKGVFTAELESALRSGEIDLAVHSLKDLPVENAPGLVVGAVGRRANPQDAFISNRFGSLRNLPPAARVGTSSLRREAQLRALRPDLTILPLRGNVDTRLRKAVEGEYEAIILAAAGLERLGLGEHIRELLPFDHMLPAPGQGALAVQCRSDDAELLRLLQPIHDEATARAVSAERAFLAALGGGCSAPVAAYAQPSGASLEIKGMVGAVDGSRLVRVSASGADPFALGRLLAEKAFAAGAGELLR